MKELNKLIAHSKKRIQALTILVDKAEELGRLPMKSDLTSEELYTVKNMLGPFPRALEAAGLKEVSDHYRRKMEKKGRQVRSVLEEEQSEECSEQPKEAF